MATAHALLYGAREEVEAVCVEMGGGGGGREGCF